MATSAELERLDALTKQLIPLTRTQPGAPIRAQDWNAVVGALVDVARAILANAAAQAVPPHTHTEQVSLGWLDPRLRSTIERGPMSDPQAVARLGDFDRKVSRFNARLDGLDAQLGDVRNRVVNVATRDLVREKDVTETRRTIDGLADARNDVAAVRETLRSVQADLGVAVDAARRLVVDGQPLDFTALTQRIVALEQLRTQLTAPDGTLLDAAALEARLTQLTNTLVTQEQLTAALNERVGRLSPEDIAGLRDTLGNELRAGFNTSIEQTAAGLRGEMAQRFGDQDARIARAIADATPGLRDAIRDDVRQDIDAAVTRSASATAAGAARALEERSAELRGETSRAVDAVSASVVATARGEVKAQLPPLLNPTIQSVAALDTRLTKADAKLDDLSSRVDSSAAQLTAQTSTLAALDRKLDSSQQAINARLSALEARHADLRTALSGLEGRLTQVDRKIDTLDRDTRGRLDSAVSELRASIATATTIHRIGGGPG